MKIALITDPHLESDTQRFPGLDPLARVDMALEAVKQQVPDADLLVLLGDLTDTCSVGSYQAVRERLTALGMPTRVLVGNHDDRQSISSAWPDLPVDENGFLQSSMITDNLALLFLDTHEPGTHAGHYCAARQSWLAAELARAGDRPSFLFMHHQPGFVGTRVDDSRLQQHEDLARIIKREGNVRQIICGHTHMTVAGAWRGIAWTSLQATHVQVGLDFPERPRRYYSGPAHIGVMLIDGNGDSAVHFYDFLQPYPPFQTV
ncbi:3',5'-cyclic AMP phosphodiesterase CpdA [Ensifer sp. SEMIA 135]|uniref:metallophosphoesterase n=1 Tax=Rhizobium meliloti TaxID=382 RepID=UPI000FD93780|nr:metallophosphoesterase [Sinorhizobium meliloti]RVL21106.1 phosphodiesterase [Sinorhizobium meliloti]RVP94616.1 phosphodiesterase [Sinorhizobium meliloti]TWA88498.1 3',5'-cyclic AMP phosphodiesterase CpdA [Ensifer sp. SEMIA 134]TWB24032.1 3',5'-cyclic AMP phosphodiesterase CpdA [Ensifer sp. SEMIA 135]